MQKRPHQFVTVRKGRFCNFWMDWCYRLTFLKKRTYNYGSVWSETGVSGRKYELPCKFYIVQDIYYCVAIWSRLFVIVGKRALRFMTRSIIEFSSFFSQISNRWGSNRKEQGSKLNLTKTRRTDSGQYTCIASNGVGQPDSAQITLRVQCKFWSFKIEYTNWH